MSIKSNNMSNSMFIMCLFGEDTLPEFRGLNQTLYYIILQEFAKVGWHGEARSCQLDGGLEQFGPGQLSIQLVCTFITTEFSWYAYPLTACETNRHVMTLLKHKIKSYHNLHTFSNTVNLKLLITLHSQVTIVLHVLHLFLEQ